MAAPASRMILVAGLAGLALRLVFGLAYWIDKPLTHDEGEYLELARSLSAGRGFAYGPEHDVGTAQQFGRAPLYPMFLAAIGATGAQPDSAPTRVKSAQAVLGDQPTVSVEVVQRVVATWREGGGPVVAPRYRGIRGNPVLFDEALFSALGDLVGDHGARDLIASDLSHREVARGGMREVQTAHRGRRRHRARLGQMNAELLGAEELEERALLGVIGTRGIAGRRANAAIALRDQLLARELLVLRVPLATDVLMQFLRERFRDRDHEWMTHSCASAVREHIQSLGPSRAYEQSRMAIEIDRALVHSGG